MEEEILMIEKNNTWELVAIPKEREVVSLKWIYKSNSTRKEIFKNHKARFVARDFTQKLGSDFMEISLQLLVLRQLEL